MLETFEIKINGSVYPDRMTMERAIAIARQKAIDGTMATLSVKNKSGEFVKLGVYYPSAQNPRMYAYKEGDKIIKGFEPCCDVIPVI